MFPFGDKEIRIGMVGFTEGNAHPFSWSAMINGSYDADLMKDYCKTLYPTIPQYLAKQPAHTLGIPGAKVTHICFTGYVGREDAEMCAKINGIPNVVDTPEEMIGQVDAVIIATDIGDEHVDRCRPFVEAGIPMFVDKPLVNKEEDLQVFCNWRKAGAKFISSSSLRYTKELEPLTTAIDRLYNDRLRDINQLCETYYEHSDTPRQATKVFEQVRQTIVAIKSDEGRLRELEELVDRCRDGIMSKLREECDKLHERELKVVLYSYAGFSSRAICIFVDSNPVALSKMKYRIKSKIRESECKDAELLISALN